ncbi:MAG: GNAT family N-acetyltransferase [Alicyclobacillus sp.]|nr:GNAT family N-acetyltransferase [Alicyclobacillus sp.]
MDITVKIIDKDNYEAAHALQSEYLDSEPFLDFVKRVETYPDLYLVAAHGDDIVGVCYGNPSKRDETEISLQGIAVNLDDTKGYARIGIGSSMMREFERAVRSRGYAKIGVGAADDPKVERFYLKNGFKPKELVAKNASYEELERVPVDDYESGLEIREALRRKHNPREVIFIFEKSVVEAV